MTFPGGKIKGSARVDRRTPHKTHRPHTILLPLNSDFWEGELLGTRGDELIKILIPSSKALWLAVPPPGTSRNVRQELAAGCAGCALRAAYPIAFRAPCGRQSRLST